MDALTQYSAVKVVSLTKQPDAYDGWGVNRRAPAIGDIGTIVEISHDGAGELVYVVECGNADGSTEWLSDLGPKEIVALEV